MMASGTLYFSPGLRRTKAPRLTIFSRWCSTKMGIKKCEGQGWNQMTSFIIPIESTHCPLFVSRTYFPKEWKCTRSFFRQNSTLFKKDSSWITKKISFHCVARWHELQKTIKLLWNQQWYRFWFHLGHQFCVFMPLEGNLCTWTWQGRASQKKCLVVERRASNFGIMFYFLISLVNPAQPWGHLSSYDKRNCVCSTQIVDCSMS